MKTRTASKHLAESNATAVAYVEYILHEDLCVPWSVVPVDSEEDCRVSYSQLQQSRWSGGRLLGFVLGFVLVGMKILGIRPGVCANGCSIQVIILKE